MDGKPGDWISVRIDGIKTPQSAWLLSYENAIGKHWTLATLGTTTRFNPCSVVILVQRTSDHSGWKQVIISPSAISGWIRVLMEKS